ncbi:hypothetical protein KUCAC02_036286, partial [Chaenocephalus aceratus]
MKSYELSIPDTTAFGAFSEPQHSSCYRVFEAGFLRRRASVQEKSINIMLLAHMASSSPLPSIIPDRAIVISTFQELREKSIVSQYLTKPNTSYSQPTVVLENLEYAGKLGPPGRLSLNQGNQRLCGVGG